MSSSLANQAANILRILGESLRQFSQNQGYLLSAALAYYILLSLLPLILLSLIVLAQFIDEQSLIHLLRLQLHNLLPAAADSLISQVKHAYNSRGLLGTMGIVSLIIFSGLVFRTLQKILRVIFKGGRLPIHQHLLINIIVPNFFVLLFLFLTFILSIADGAISTPATTRMELFNRFVDFSPYLTTGIKFFTLITNFLLLALFYKLLPRVAVKWRHAFIGAFIVGLLWMISKKGLVYFYEHFSSVSILYGALSSLFILLISLEVLSLLLLFGAQIIAVYQGRESFLVQSASSSPDDRATEQ